MIRNIYVKTDCEGGLFSRLIGGYIENLGIENGHIESTANLRCGAIVGEHHANAWLKNCFARGNFEFVTAHADSAVRRQQASSRTATPLCLSFPVPIPVTVGQTTATRV